MSKFIAPDKVYKERISTCKACPHLQAGNFCGTPLRGSILEDGTKLCGCAMSVKARLHFAACPLNKWEKVLGKRELAEIEAAIDRKSAKEIWDMYAKFVGIHPNSGTNCPPCVKSAVEELRSLL